MMWLTGQFASFVVPVKDIQYTICFYSVGGSKHMEELSEYCNNKLYSVSFIAALLPFIFSSIQLVQLMRILKIYRGPLLFSVCVNALAITVTVLSSLSGKLSSDELFYAWIPFVSLTTVSATINDFYYCMFDTDENNRTYLRKKRLYKRGFIYHVIFICIFILRCSWMLTVSGDVAYAFNHKEILVGITAFLEIIRRAL